MKYLIALLLGLGLFTVPELAAQRTNNQILYRRPNVDIYRPGGNSSKPPRRTNPTVDATRVQIPSQVILTDVYLPGRGGTSTPKPDPKPEEAEDPDAFLELQPEGPSTGGVFELESDILADVGYARGEVLGIDTRILSDANPKSGYFYYYPREYHLGWSEATGKPAIDITYEQATTDGPGKVSVTATLYPTLKDQDLTVARRLLQTDLKGKAIEQFGIKELMPVPMTQAPAIELSNLAQFGVAPEDIDFQATMRLGDPIKLSFKTDQIDALMAMFFNNIGLFGSLVVYTNGYPEGFPIPINLKVDSPETYGYFEMVGSQWRTDWHNPTHYPITLGHLHALRLERNGRYRVYSWKADRTVIPPDARVNFSANSVPAWLDGNSRVQRVWMDFAINECEDCDQRIKEDILGTVAQHDVARPEKIEFTILTPMAFTEASLMRIKVRSPQASTTGSEKIELESVTVSEDGAILDGGTLFVRDGRVDFEYKMVVYLEDGTTYESGWIPSNSKEVVIGSRQIKDNIPQFADR